MREEVLWHLISLSALWVLIAPVAHDVSCIIKVKLHFKGPLGIKIVLVQVNEYKMLVVSAGTRPIYCL